MPRDNYRISKWQGYEVFDEGSDKQQVCWAVAVRRSPTLSEIVEAALKEFPGTPLSALEIVVQVNTHPLRPPGPRFMYLQRRT
jgi:hypothetical protein